MADQNKSLVTHHSEDYAAGFRDGLQAALTAARELLQVPPLYHWNSGWETPSEEKGDHGQDRWQTSSGC